MILEREYLISTSNLQGLKNDKGKFYTVKPQLPEPLATQKKERDEVVRQIKKFNKTIPDNESEKRKKYEIRDKTLFVNNVAQKKHITPPTLQQIFKHSTGSAK